MDQIKANTGTQLSQCWLHPSVILQLAIKNMVINNHDATETLTHTHVMNVLTDTEHSGHQCWSFVTCTEMMGTLWLIVS